MAEGYNDYDIEQAAKIMMGEAPMPYNTAPQPIYNSLPPAPMVPPPAPTQQAWQPITTAQPSASPYNDFAPAPKATQPNNYLSSQSRYNDHAKKREAFTIDLNSLSLSIDKADIQVKKILDDALSKAQSTQQQADFKSEL